MVDVVIIGGGPVGLTCGIEATRAGLQAVIVEKGALVNSLVGYPLHMEFFSTPELLEIGGHPFPTLHYKPMRNEAIDYYRRVAQQEALNLRLYEQVLLRRRVRWCLHGAYTQGYDPVQEGDRGHGLL